MTREDLYLAGVSAQFQARSRVCLYWVRDAGRLDRSTCSSSSRADTFEEPRAVPEDQRDDVELELVDEARCQVLIDGAGAAADEDVLSRRSCRAWSRADSIPSVTKVNVVSRG